MSTILDALKKSERDRTVVRGLGFGDAGRWRKPPRRRGLWVAVGGLVASLLLAAYWTSSHLLGFRAASYTAESIGNASTPPTEKIPGSNQGERATVPTMNRSEHQSSLAPLQDAAVVTGSSVAALASPMEEANMLSSLPAEFQQSVPLMTVNIHVFAPEEAQRILYINNRQYRHGEEIPGGVFVEAIVPDGVVLQFHGKRFKLPRPS